MPHSFSQTYPIPSADTPLWWTTRSLSTSPEDHAVALEVLKTRVRLDIDLKTQTSGMTVLAASMMPLSTDDQSILQGIQPRLSHILSGSAKRGYLDLIKIFAPPGSIAERDRQDQLHAIPCALRGGHIDCAQALFEAGCPIDPRTGDHVSLCIKASLERSESVQFLLDHGVDINHSDSNGNTLLHLCCARSLPETLRFLLKLGADHERRNINGETPAMLAALLEHMKCLSALIEDGCDIDARNNAPEAFGATAAILCAEHARINSLDLLLQAGASLGPAQRWAQAVLNVIEAYDAQTAARVSACISMHTLARSTPQSTSPENANPSLRI